MGKIKHFFRNVRNALKKFNWNFRNLYIRMMNRINGFILKIWHKITFKEKRDLKKQNNALELRKYLNVGEDVDIHLDVNYEKYRIQFTDKKEKALEELKVLKAQDDKNFEAIEDKKAEIEHINQGLKLLPPSRKKVQQKERAIKTVQGWGKALLYLWPVLILLTIFSFYPIINSFRLVIYEGYNESTGSIGGYTVFGNFISVLSDSNFIVPSSHTGSSAMINTLLIVVITVPISIIIALLISVLLNSIKPLKSIFQTIFFLPYVTNSLAVGLVFAYIFRKDGGLFNKFLEIFNVQGGAWVSHGASYGKAMFVLVLFTIWNGLAFKIMVFLSAIQGIDKQYYQAASIDATPKYKQLRRITIPLISPTILYIVITSVIGAFKTYSSVIAIFGNTGGPAGATYNLKTIVFYIYDFFESTNKLSEAAAASIILFVIILFMTIIQMQVSKKRVHY